MKATVSRQRKDVFSASGIMVSTAWRCHPDFVPGTPQFSHNGLMTVNIQPASVFVASSDGFAASFLVYFGLF